MAEGFDRLAPGLTPGARLRSLRRMRGLSQDGLIRALERQAAADGATLPARESLKVTVSRWENDHQAPDGFYRALLCRLFEVDEGDLGLTPRTRRPVGDDLTPRMIGRDVVSVYADALQQYIRADQLMGPGRLRRVVAEQAAALDGISQAATGEVRRELLYLSVRYAELLGWLGQDSGDLAAAERWTARAGDLAQLYGDPNLIAYVAMRRAGVLAELGRPADSLDYAELAARHRSKEAPRGIALAQRQLAMTHAWLGNKTECRRAADAAVAAAHEPDDGSFSIASYCTQAFAHMEAGGSLALLGCYDLAVEHLKDALRKWAPGQKRDAGLCVARLADIHATAGHIERASLTAGQAVNLYAEAPSARTARTLRIVRNRLHPHRKHPVVRELTAKLADVL